MVYSYSVSKQGTSNSRVDPSKWDWKLAFDTSELSTAKWLKWAAIQQAETLNREPTKFHRWLNLEKSGRIKEVLSMNVDSLESKAGLIPEVHYRAVTTQVATPN